MNRSHSSSLAMKVGKLDLCLLPKVHGQLLDEGQEHGLREGAGGRVEDLGGVQQLTAHQGLVMMSDSMFCWNMMFFTSG